MLKLNKTYGIYKVIRLSKTQKDKDNPSYFCVCTKCGWTGTHKETEILNSKICRHKKSAASELANISKEELQKILDSSTSFSNVLDKIGFSVGSGSHAFLNEIIIEKQCTLDKMNENKKALRSASRKPKQPREIFVKNSPVKRGIGRFLKKFNLKDFSKCERCGNSEWQGEPIPLQVHHKDGIRDNNSLDNLEILCPNCHALTENFMGKNIGTNKKLYTQEEIEKEKSVQYINKDLPLVEFPSEGNTCIDCGKPIHKDSIRCKDCYEKYRNSLIDKPTIEQLKKDIEEDVISLTDLGEKYKVTRTTMKRWLDEYGLLEEYYDIKSSAKIDKEQQKELTRAQKRLGYKTYTFLGLELSASGWETALGLSQHTIIRYANTHTKEEVESKIKEIYDSKIRN